MHAQTLATISLLIITVTTARPLTTRQTNACFIIGDTALPAEVADTATSISSSITCSSSATTLSGVPDVTSGSISFSSIDFTNNPLADTDLKRFQDSLNVYLATEVGVRSVDGGLAIKVPKFFLEFQVSRIQTAQGNAPVEAGLQVDHLRDKVLKNAAGEDASLLDEVRSLAGVLS
ncbi:uncharacterized protein AB675_5737 [Cyphellophora attinorum]|uniref:DUF7143 domain-containing protein n=1 Tax=Cyphellophora attinorum TaxID=1664694 RepID=A0A0N1HS00_9EURO|nr:uncharacterized protein AB675_5737 [Phialophora attinorum]KPI38760.1 hypothetical protein AB675_5737 [Phialophora attinorum]